MTAEQFATLVNAGVGGAVIAVVILFLRFIKERDAEWRSFFTTVRATDNEVNGRLATVIEKLVERVESLEGKFDQHNATEMEFLRSFTASSKERKTQPRKDQ